MASSSNSFSQKEGAELYIFNELINFHFNNISVFILNYIMHFFSSDLLHFPPLGGG
jgi:hypothetical protein